MSASDRPTCAMTGSSPIVMRRPSTRNGAGSLGTETMRPSARSISVSLAVTGNRRATAVR